MDKLRKLLSGGIRLRIFSMLLITIVLIIAAYTAVFFYQTNRVEQLVSNTYETQKQIYVENGLEDEYETIRSEAVNTFHREMFHARNILILLIVLIVAAGMASAYSIASRITDPLNTITRRVASLGVRNRQFQMEDVYKTGDEIEVLAESFAKQSARMTLYIDQIRRVTAEKERIGAELDMASKIQGSQLPSLFPPFPDRREFSLFASMTPAKEVGGDFYDFFMIDHDHMGFVMADVSGKGIPAALLMMVTRVLIKSGLQNGKSPAETLASVNNQLCEGNDADFFVTVWLAVLEISTGKGVAANAGHEHPVLRRVGGSYELQVYRHSMPIGAMKDLPYRQHEFQLNPGDSFFVYTDGVAEATNRNSELYGTGRMLDALNRDPDAMPELVLANVTQDINRFVDGAEQFDDITMLCFRYAGPSAGTQEKNP
ncbi:MAG: serine/threonine-protein phosphatase [Oscillospiraceae bacterium]|nr:serine/threonine-protein phosphatase [Oscillospiraceae bacterium]